MAKIDLEQIKEKLRGKKIDVEFISKNYTFFQIDSCILDEDDLDFTLHSLKQDSYISIPTEYINDIRQIYDEVGEMYRIYCDDGKLDLLIIG